MLLRLMPRVHTIASLAVISLLVCVLWVFPSVNVKSRITKAWTGSGRTIIVFGDSFSDTGDHTVALQTQEFNARRDAAEGKRWTEVLCTEFVCDTILNFARSDNVGKTYSGGAVLDNDIYANTTSSKNETSSLPDLKEQVRQWLDYEEHKNDAETDEEIIVTITFGFWDIWQYATLDYESAQNAIGSSIYVLFEQLDIITRAFEEPPRIVIPQLVDVTWTPRFMSLAREPQTTAWRYTEEQHKIVLLTDYWNTALRIAADNWTSAYLYMPDWNGWLLDQIRSIQMQKVGVLDSMNAGLEAPKIKDVSTPCKSPLVSWDGGQTLAETTHCKHSDEFLFWDDTQFGGSAHRILGQEAAKLLNSAETANARVDLHPSATKGRSGNELVKIHMIPSLAPGN